jgi:transcriptional regulator with XRE-family HTH domain
MGRAALQKPVRLAEKLSEIRQRLELSQNGLIRFLGFNDELTQAEISAFERGVRIPSLIIILRYARSISINVEILIDDELELPKRFRLS